MRFGTPSRTRARRPLSRRPGRLWTKHQSAVARPRQRGDRTRCFCCTAESGFVPYRRNPTFAGMSAVRR